MAWRGDLAALPGARRLFIAEAIAAMDAEAVRDVWRSAQAAGEPRWYLDRIAAVGRAKAGARPLGAAA